MMLDKAQRQRQSANALKKEQELDRVDAEQRHKEWLALDADIYMLSLESALPFDKKVASIFRKLYDTMDYNNKKN